MQNLISFGSEEIVKSIDEYITNYPKPYVPNEVLFSSIVEECLIYEHSKYNVKFDAIEVGNIVCTQAMEILDAIISDDLDISMLSTIERNGLNEAEELYKKIMNDCSFNDQVIEIIAAVRDQVVLLKLDKEIAPMLEYVETATFNGMGIVMQCVYADHHIN